MYVPIKEKILKPKKRKKTVKNDYKRKTHPKVKYITIRKQFGSCLQQTSVFLEYL